MKIGLSCILLLAMALPASAQQLVPVYTTQHPAAIQPPVIVQCLPGPNDGRRYDPDSRFSPPPQTSPRPRTTLPPNPNNNSNNQDSAKLDRIIDLLEQMANNQPAPPCPDPEPTPTDPPPGCNCDPTVAAKLEELRAQILLINQTLQIIQNNNCQPPTDPPTAPDPDNSEIAALLAKIAELQAKLEALQNQAPTIPDAYVNALQAIQQALTDINNKLDNGGLDDRIVDAFSEMAKAQKNTNDKLDAAIALLQEGSSKEITLIVKSAPNLPASYVDTSTIWAVQRKTGISHIVLVYNSEDPDWERLEPEYEKALHKFPAMTLVDVQEQQGLKVSPVPQMVIYFLQENKDAEIVSGDRAVGYKLRELYTN